MPAEHVMSEGDRLSRAESCWSKRYVYKCFLLFNLAQSVLKNDDGAVYFRGTRRHGQGVNEQGRTGDEALLLPVVPGCAGESSVAAESA
jgi:hypothetical protein